MTIPRLVIAGTHSGVGKTTVAVGLMAALRRRGLQVSPYKVGPDYIDPAYHRLACGRPSAALDSWMLGKTGMLRSFARTACGDIAIIEGMMGLHDGASAESDAGSTAEIARLLKAPVVLVIDASALARSAGALVLGYRQFDRRVNIAGVVANRTAGAGHAAFLTPSIEKQASTPFLGHLPLRDGASIPERNLGLVMPQETSVATVEALADLIEEHVDIDAILAVARSAPPLVRRKSPTVGVASATKDRVRIAVAQDDAFCFNYPDNMALLEQFGAELVPFSPIHDVSLPPDIDGIYIGGGYPELYGAALAANAPMRRQIRQFGEAGKPVYAECGGFMYLCETLIDGQGDAHEMVGLIPGRTVMHTSLQAIGYREVQLAGASTLFGTAGAMLRGHEFRYSTFDDSGTLTPGPSPRGRGVPVAQVRISSEVSGTLTPGPSPRGRGVPVAQARIGHAFDVAGKPAGFVRGSVVASYIHLHFGSRPAAASAFVRQCRRMSKSAGKGRA